MASHFDESNSAKYSLSLASSSYMPQGTPPSMSDVEAMLEGEQWLKGFEEQQSTPRKSAPTTEGILPAFSMSQTTHLPTPESPGNVDMYASVFSFPHESPVRAQGQHPSMMADFSSSHQSFMTPESSPIHARKTARAQDEAAALTPIRLSSPFSPRPSSHAEMDPPANLSPPLSRDSSRLSSPFREQPRFAGRGRSRTKTPMRTHSDPIDAFSPASSSSKTPLPLSAPVPQRAVGGEFQRIRLQMAADQAALLSETEARRPDYLVRERRPESAPDPLGGDELDWVDPDMLPPHLGVTVSPVKGRRIQLFQETSDESFEQSLLAGGYPGYGSTPAFDPQTPDHKLKPGLSQRALQWLQQVTPGQPTPGTVIAEPEEEEVPSEKELLKRKRLAAFEEHPDTSEPPAKLQVVEVNGFGRVLMNIVPEEQPAPTETPARRRAGSKRKRKSAAHSTPSKRVYGAQPEETEVKGPNWLDNDFPWCVRVKERKEMSKQEREQRLKQIARYLERSDSEDDIVEDQALHPLVQSDEEVAPRRGRGKMVPLKVHPVAGTSAQGRREIMLVPSDPADARAALLSKRSVRTFAFRRRQLREQDEDDPNAIICVCDRGEDGEQLVQCDECLVWYHLSCVGIQDLSELPPRDEPYFCPPCVDESVRGSRLLPTFVPTDDEPPLGGRRDPLFYQSSIRESPSASWNNRTREPRTPVRGQDASEPHTSRSSWGDSSRGGPSTPVNTAQSVRVYTTPGAREVDNHFDSPFDPSQTPSRGTGPAEAFTTPKWDRSTSFRTPGLGSLKFSGGSLSFSQFAANGLSPTPRFRDIYSHDDTPVRRSGPIDESVWRERLWLPDSPVRSKNSTTETSFSVFDNDKSKSKTAVSPHADESA